MHFMTIEKRNYQIVRITNSDLNNDIIELIHTAFEDYHKKGIEFTCYSYTIEDIKKKVLSDDCFVAIDSDGHLLGLTSFSIDSHRQVAYANITAISPSAQRQGIATALRLERNSCLAKQNVRFLYSDTAVSAKSSVRWHLDKCRCHIIGLESFRSTNYYSFIFVEEIIPTSPLHKYLIYPLRFFFSSVLCLLCKRKDGSLRFIGRIIAKLIRLIRTKCGKRDDENNSSLS